MQSANMDMNTLHIWEKIDEATVSMASLFWLKTILKTDQNPSLRKMDLHRDRSRSPRPADEEDAELTEVRKRIQKLSARFWACSFQVF